MLAMRLLGPAALALAFVLIAPGRASADIVARGVRQPLGRRLQAEVRKPRVARAPTGPPM